MRPPGDIMKVTLEGPDGLGHWFLADEDGNTFPVVRDHEGHPAAAALFGWTAPIGITDQEELIQNALAWLTENVGEEIKESRMPTEAVAHFTELAAEQ